MALFETRERRDIERIDRIIRYATEGECLVLQLLHYFGETGADARGGCSRCTDAGASRPMASATPDIHGAHIAHIQSIMTENHPALHQPRQVARYLCGLPSPATTRAKLKQHALFGSLATLPFNTVLQVVEQRRGQ